MAAMHEIDYTIYGDDMQFVEVELDPQEAVVAEAGGMMYMEDGIEMETIFGDGSQQQRRLHGRADGRRQAPAHRRVALHDRVPEPGHGQEAGRLRRALPRQDHPHRPAPSSAAS